MPGGDAAGLTLLRLEAATCGVMARLQLLDSAVGAAHLGSHSHRTSTVCRLAESLCHTIGFAYCRWLRRCRRSQVQPLTPQTACSICWLLACSAAALEVRPSYLQALLLCRNAATAVQFRLSKAHCPPARRLLSHLDVSAAAGEAAVLLELLAAALATLLRDLQVHVCSHLCLRSSTVLSCNLTVL